MKAPACADDPDLFASTDVIDHRTAAAHCRVCPHVTACLQQLQVASAATGTPGYGPTGTWAGLLLTRAGVREVA